MVVEAGLVLVADEVAQLLLRVVLDEEEVLDLAVAGLHVNHELRKQNGRNESKKNWPGRRWHRYWQSHWRIQASRIRLLASKV